MIHRGVLGQVALVSVLLPRELEAGLALELFEGSEVLRPDRLRVLAVDAVVVPADCDFGVAYGDTAKVFNALFPRASLQLGDEGLGQWLRAVCKPVQGQFRLCRFLRLGRFSLLRHTLVFLGTALCLRDSLDSLVEKRDALIQSVSSAVHPLGDCDDILLVSQLVESA